MAFNAFKFSEQGPNFSANVMQWFYYPPEIIRYVLQVKKGMKPKLPETCAPAYTIDIYSLGMILLEICIGFPVWIDKKCIINHFNEKLPILQDCGMMFESHDPIKMLTKILDF